LFISIPRLLYIIGAPFTNNRYDDFGTGDIDRLSRLLKWIDDIGALLRCKLRASPEADALALGWRSTFTWRLGNIAGFKTNRNLQESY